MPTFEGLYRSDYYRTESEHVHHLQADPCSPTPETRFSINSVRVLGVAHAEAVDIFELFDGDLADLDMFCKWLHRKEDTQRLTLWLEKLVDAHVLLHTTTSTPYADPIYAQGAQTT